MNQIMNENAVALLVIPEIRVQNANAISSDLTWGFPSITAFMGLMWALERNVSSFNSNIIFKSVGVICHAFEPLISQEGFVKSFRLSRNPLSKDGTSPSFVEEGKTHLKLTLVFSVDGSFTTLPDEEQKNLAIQIQSCVSNMKIAGGSILSVGSQLKKTKFVIFHEDSEKRQKQFRTLRRNWLPGFALVLRQDLLQRRFEDLFPTASETSLLDAWLDLSRLNWKANKNTAESDENENVEWTVEKNEGWIVPIPIGYSAISQLYSEGNVANARDMETPFRFVESLYSVGQWIGPHRLNSVDEMLWFNDSEASNGVYKCSNNYALSHR